MNPSAAAARSVGVVVIFRDRDPRSVLNQMRTLAAQTRPPDAFVLVNFGAPCPEFEAAAPPFPYLYRHLPQPLPWSLALAKNQGVALLPPVETVLFLDADVLLAPNFIECGLRRLGPGVMINCRLLDLPEGAVTAETDVVRDFEHLKTVATVRRELSAVGACQWLRTRALQAMHGHDEAYKMWSFGDVDFQRRARWVGLHPLHLDEETTMLHQWHLPKADFIEDENAMSVNMALAREWYDRNRARLRFRSAEWDVAKFDPAKINPRGWGRLPS